MTLKEILVDYVDGNRDAVTTIRILTSIIRPEQAIDILALVNQITRMEHGDMDKDTFVEIYKLR